MHPSVRAAIVFVVTGVDRLHVVPEAAAEIAAHVELSVEELLVGAEPGEGRRTGLEVDGPHAEQRAVLEH